MNPVTNRVIHVVESQIPTAGSVSICLPGLIEALGALQIEGAIVERAEGLDDQIAFSQVVHIHGWDYPLALHAARSAKRNRKPYILSPLGKLTPGPGNRIGVMERTRRYFTQRSLLLGAAAITAMNEIDHQSLSAERTHSKIVLLPYGLNFHANEGEQTSAADTDVARVLLMLGPLDPVLGCVVLLKTFAELGAVADGWAVMLAGEDRGHWRGKLEAAVRRKGGEARVSFLDANTPQKQEQLLREAAVLVAPSLHVSPAVSIMQALAVGVPVVASEKAVPRGLSGEVRVCGSTRTELRNALRNAMEAPPERRKELADTARDKARGLYDWSVLAPRYAELYTACLRK